MTDMEHAPHLAAFPGAPRPGAIDLDLAFHASSPPRCMPMAAPADAIDLLASLDLWRSRDQGPARWELTDGVLEVLPGAGDIVTREHFGDLQLHAEFWIPELPGATGQDRGNGGLFLQGSFEIQLLDSRDAPLGRDVCGAIYDVAVPMQNAALSAAEWQSLDIAFRAWSSAAAGVVTVFLNAVLIHHGVALAAPTPGGLAPGEGTGPLLLQDHGAALRFRNVWVWPVAR